MKAKPKDATVHFNLAVIYEDSYNFEKAIEHYNATLLLDPVFQEAYLGRGNCFLAMGNFEAATADLRNSLAVNTVTKEKWANYKETGTALDENDLAQYNCTDFYTECADQFQYNEKLNLLLRLHKYNDAISFITRQQSLSHIGKFDYFSAAKIHFVKTNSLLGYLYLQRSFNNQPDAYREFRVLFPKVASSKLFEDLFKVRLSEIIFQ